VRYATIFIIMLLLVASKPSHAIAMPGGGNGNDPQAASPGHNPDASGKYHLGAGVTAPKLLFALIQNSPTRLVIRRYKGLLCFH